MIPHVQWKDLDMLNGYLLGKTTIWEGLPYGKEDQMLFINDEPSKAFRNSKCNGFLWSLLKDISCQKNKVQWLNLAPWLWLTLIGLPFTSIVGMHFEIITKFVKPCLEFVFPTLFLVYAIHEKQ